MYYYVLWSSRKKEELDGRKQGLVPVYILRCATATAFLKVIRNYSQTETSEAPKGLAIVKNTRTSLDSHTQAERVTVKTWCNNCLLNIGIYGGHPVLRLCVIWSTMLQYLDASLYPY